MTLDVTVDGIPGAALGVMSQGELHSLALSLFLPRATLSESPFRFVVIDDPVQSMDPARVDGLARALEETARTRQVIVFTHDERLPEAVRRLAIKSTILSMTRRPKSVVEVRTCSGSRPGRTSRMRSRWFTRPTCQCRSCADSCQASAARPLRRRSSPWSAAGDWRPGARTARWRRSCKEAGKLTPACGAGLVRRQGKGRRRDESAEQVRLVGRRCLQAVQGWRSQRSRRGPEADHPGHREARRQDSGARVSLDQSALVDGRARSARAGRSDDGGDLAARDSAPRASGTWRPRLTICGVCVRRASSSVRPARSCSAFRSIYPATRKLAERVSYAWAGLSRACHQHPYELSPTSSELLGWLATVEQLIARVKLVCAVKRD